MINKVKGTTVAFLRKFIGNQPKPVQNAFLSQLDSEEKAMFETALPIAWLDIGVVTRLYEVAAAVAFPGEPNGVRRLGELTADHDLRTIYKLFLRVATVEFAVKQAARVWSTYHDTGVPLVHKEADKNSVSFIVRNYPDFPKGYRQVVSGYILGMLKLTGVKNVRVTLDESEPTAWKWTATWS